MVRVDVAVTPSLATARERTALAVVIDVLRATSTIVTALENGAAGIIPVRHQDDAIAVARRVGRDRSLLCGERESRLIAGFDLDNSPRSYTRAAVAGKTVVLTTTNGTRALTEAASRKTQVICGALINRERVAAAVAAHGGEDALLVCSGSEGEFSFEDFVCAGAIVDRVHQIDRDIVLGDAARCAMLLYVAIAKKLTTAIAGGEHARRLVALGFGDDIAYCARVDVFDVLPVYADGIISA
jgi:2-phosphosulfolactate phosphatase